MRWTWARAAALAAVVGLSALGLAFAVPRGPNVLWISIDSLRADRLPIHGYGASRTPFIDYLAGQGVVFEQAYADAPWTTAAMASAMTGRFAVHHGLRTPFAPLADGEATVAEIFNDAGWQTGAIVGSFSLDRVFGLDQGFADYDDRYDSPLQAAGDRPHLPSQLVADVGVQRAYLRRKERHDSFRTDAAVGDAALAWLQRASRWRPFFLWVHFFGPHQRRQYGDSVTEAIERAMGPYDARVEGVDAQIGRILEELTRSGRLGDTIIVLQGDHGQGHLQHQELNHGQQLYDSVLRIPLLIAWPGKLRGLRATGMARAVDVMPTILELAGLTPPAGRDGQSLVPRLRGADGESEPLLAETLLSAEGDLSDFLPDGSLAKAGVRRLALRTPKWKYISSRPHPLINYEPQPAASPGQVRLVQEELYDLGADPGETRNLAADRADALADMRQKLSAAAPES